MNQDASRPGRGYRPFLLVVLFFSLYLSYLILLPFVHTLIIAIVMSSVFSPLQTWLVRIFRGRKTAAAAATVFVITFAVAVPVFFFISALVSQGLDSINDINEWIRAGNLQKIAEHPKIVAYSNWLHERFPALELEKMDVGKNLLELSKGLGQFLLSKGATLAGNVVSLLTQFGVMLFVAFYLIRDGEGMVEQCRYYSPLRKDQWDRLLNGIRTVARSVLLGTFLTALCQGIVGGIGLALVGIPGLFWGTVTGFSSLIPIVGTSLVWIPAVGYLVLLGQIKSAIFLAVWSMVLLGSIDNFLRPFLMKGEGRMSPFYIFLAIIGGVQYFGLLGILYGPLILSFAMIMLYMYGAEYRSDLLAEEETSSAKSLPPEAAAE